MNQHQLIIIIPADDDLEIQKTCIFLLPFSVEKRKKLKKLKESSGRFSPLLPSTASHMMRIFDDDDVEFDQTDDDYDDEDDGSK